MTLQSVPGMSENNNGSEGFWRKIKQQVSLAQEITPANFLTWYLHPNGDMESFLSPVIADHIAAVKDHLDEWNCYWGIGLRPTVHPAHPKWRGSEKDIIFLLGLHGDLDYAVEGAHSRIETLPPNEEACIGLIEGLPPPTFIVHTGYGLQPIWLTKEPTYLVTAEDRAAAIRYLVFSDHVAIC